VLSHATNESLRLQLKSGNLTAIIPNGLYSKNKTHVPEVTPVTYSDRTAVAAACTAVSQFLFQMPVDPRQTQAATQPEISVFGYYAVSTGKGWQTFRSQ